MTCQLLRNIALAVLLTTVYAVAQGGDTPARNTVYRLEYTVIEMDGAKKVSSRTYTLLVEDRKRGSMRVGTRVPVYTSENQYTYIDVGVDLDATPTMQDSTTLRLDTTINVNSIVAESGAPRGKAPVIRNCRDSVTNVIPLDKTVTLTTQDDPGNPTSLQVQVVAKLVK